MYNVFSLQVFEYFGHHKTAAAAKKVISKLFNVYIHDTASSIYSFESKTYNKFARKLYQYGAAKRSWHLCCYSVQKDDFKSFLFYVKLLFFFQFFLLLHSKNSIVLKHTQGTSSTISTVMNRTCFAIVKDNMKKIL